MRCPKCLHPVAERELRCSSCGTALPVSDATTLTEATEIPYRPSLDFPPGSRFAGRYTIIEKIGEGGMGVVYKALDTVLDQQVVALKLIQPSLASIPTFVQRFKREVRLTRQVAHPNVCRVHDLGEGDGVLYLSMEWIGGETLGRLLQKAGALEQDRALEIAQKIAQGLAAAHAKGIVHRDLKPGNVMIDERGEIYVMDFGLAVGQGREDADHPGVAVGTPPYMAPEQERGEEADGRADLFALGVILEEMLSGVSPDPRERPVIDLGSGARRRIVPVLESLLAEDREKRFPSADAAAQAIRQVREGTTPLPTPEAGRARKVRLGWWIGTVASALLLAGAMVYYRRPASALRNSSSSPVLPRTSSPAQTYFDRGVDYLASEATLRNTDSAVRMFYRSVKEDDAFAPAWAGLGEAYWFRYYLNRDPSSKENALHAVQKALELSPDLPETLCARGVGYFAEADYPAAKAELEKAVTRRPSFDRAWAWLGTAYREMEEYASGRAALLKAIELKPRSAKYQFLFGNFLKHFNEYDEAGKAYQKAIDLDPKSTTAWNNLGAMYLHLQRYGDAAEAFQRSLEIEKRGNNYTNLGTAYYYQGQYEHAATAYRSATDLEPKEAENWRSLGDAFAVLGKGGKSREAYEKAVLVQRAAVAEKPHDALAHATLGLCCAKAKVKGWKECARDEGSRAAVMEPKNADIAFRNSVALCILGLDGQALDSLENAVRLGTSKAEIEHEPDLSRLRGNPRYRKILDLAS